LSGFVGQFGAYNAIDFVRLGRFISRMQDQKDVDVRETSLLKLDCVDMPVDFPKNVAYSKVLQEFGHLEMKDSATKSGRS
jgi:hypothetical protein